MRRRRRRLSALRLEVVEIAAIVAQVGENGERESDSCEHQGYDRRGDEREQGSVAQRIVAGLGSSSAARETASSPLNGGRGELGRRPRLATPSGRRARSGSVAPDTRRLRVHGRGQGPPRSPITASPCRAREAIDDRRGARTGTCAGRRSRVRECRPLPPASAASRGVASTAGGVESVACRARIRASFCWLIRVLELDAVARAGAARRRPRRATPAQVEAARAAASPRSGAPGVRSAVD